MKFGLRQTSITFFTILLFLSYAGSFAQSVTAYTDNRGNLQVFDKGMIRQIEYLPVHSYKIGGNCIAYVDNKNDFKIYYDGQTINLVNAADFSYYMTDYLTAFMVGRVLYAFDKGEKKTLCYYTTFMNVDDSVLAFFDDSQSSLFIYYNGRLSNAEDALLSMPKAIKTGPNIVAWINQSNKFMIFYHGASVEVDNIPPLAFAVGRDIVAYVDEYERKFRLFYKGQMAIAEEFIPDSFKVGFGIAAYIDDTKNFRIFIDGETRRVLSYEPDYFYVKGNVIVYGINGAFNIIYNGQDYHLQNVAPRDFQIGNNGVAWIDDSGRLQLFDKGNTYTVSYEIINNYHLNGDVLKYEVGVNTTNVFYKGKNY